jgi:hypothetical protein
MSHSIKVRQSFFLGVQAFAFDFFVRRFSQGFVCLKGLGSEKLFDFKIQGSLPNVITVDEGGLFFDNHQRYLNLDLKCFIDTWWGGIGDDKNLERAVP